jgi:hypothetical protein
VPDIAVVEPRDYQELAQFNAAFDGLRDSDYWLSRFRLWWDANPAFAPGLPRGYLARDSKGIVGFLGSVPGLFRADGQDQLTFNATTYRVLPEHRSVSLKLYLGQVRAAAGRLMFNNTANETVRKVLEYLRFVSLPSYASGRVFLVPLRHRNVARAYLRDQPRVPQPLRALGALPLRAAGLPTRLQLWRAHGQRVRQVFQADAAFDQLWQRTRDRYRFTSVRSAARLNWICFGSPHLQKTLLGYYEGDLLRGYLMLAEARWRGLRVLESVDVWSDQHGPANQALLHALIAGAVAHGKQSGVDLLALHDPSAEVTQALRGLQLRFTAADDRRHFYGCGDAEPPPMTPDNAYLTGMEGDLAI